MAAASKAAELDSLRVRLPLLPLETSALGQSPAFQAGQAGSIPAGNSEITVGSSTAEQVPVKYQHTVAGLVEGDYRHGTRPSIS